MSQNLKELRKYIISAYDTETDEVKESEDVRGVLDLVENAINERIKELEDEKKLCITPERKAWKQVAINELKYLLGK